MRYRILAPGYLNNPFRLISTLYTDEKTGEERDLKWPGMDEVFSLQVEVGMVVELDDRTKPAPWMVNERRKICLACKEKETCPVLRVGEIWFSDANKCPLGLLKSFADMKLEKAFPPGIEPITGCC